jgi:hypothetical protein
MNSIYATQPIYDAVDIAVQYFELKGDSRLSIKHKIAAHIVDMFNSGEKRSLMLANLAIKKAERDLLAEKEIREATLVPFYYVNA